MSFTVSCCSSVDLPFELLQKKNIFYVPMHYCIDGEDFLDTLEDREPMAEFYQRMSQGMAPSTSQVNAAEYVSHFEKLLKDGNEILHICLSTGITGTYNSALIAKQELEDKYPDARIALVDSLNASCGYGIIALKAAQYRDEGKSFEEAVELIEKFKHNVKGWFFSTDLTSFVRGGRLSAVSGWFGTVLKICPLLKIDESGKLVPVEKCRGKAKAILSCYEKFLNEAQNGSKYDGECFIAHSACPEDARALADLIEKSFSKLKGKVNIVDVGKIIGTHTGPGTTGLFFVSE